MFGIKLTPITEADIQRQLRVLAPQAIKRAEVAGLNRSLRSASSLISRTVRRDIALKARTIKDSLHTTRARRSQSVPTAEIKVDRKAVPLKEYGAKQIRAGLSYRTSKRGGRKRIKSGFVVGSYGLNAFLRVGSARGPLKMLFGPSVGGAVRARDEEILGGIEELIDKNIKERVRWEIQKLIR